MSNTKGKGKKGIMINKIGALCQSMRCDAEDILDGIPLDLMNATKSKYDENSDLMLVALGDSDDLIEVIIAYSNSKRLPSMSADQRWRFATRLFFAASTLSPFAKVKDGDAGAFLSIIANMDTNELIQLAMIDFARVAKAVIDEYLFIPERNWIAPLRQPWIGDSLSKQEKN